MWRDVVCTVGSRRDDGTWELLGPGRMAYVAEGSEIAPGVTLTPGLKVLVDATSGNLDEPSLLVMRLRSVAPAPEDHERYERFNEGLREAGLGAMCFDDVATHLDTQFARVLRVGATRAPSPLEDWMRKMDEKGRRFPTLDWAEDPEPGFEDMTELLRAVGVDAPLALDDARDDFERRWELGEDEEIIRGHTCSLICAAANRLLEESGLTQRWIEFANLDWENDVPLWLLLTQDAANTLLRRALLVSPARPVF